MPKLIFGTTIVAPLIKAKVLTKEEGETLAKCLNTFIGIRTKDTEKITAIEGMVTALNSKLNPKFEEVKKAIKENKLKEQQKKVEDLKKQLQREENTLMEMEKG